MALLRTVQSGADLRKVADALRGGRGRLRSEFTAAFRDAGEDTLRRVKRNIETNQLRGRRTRSPRRFVAIEPGSDIRARISRVTELKITTGSTDPTVSFQVRTDRLADIGAQNLPYLIDSARVWRHPIEGNRRAWAGQSGRPWFYQEIRDDLEQFRAKAADAVDRTIAAIEGAGG